MPDSKSPFSNKTHSDSLRSIHAYGNSEHEQHWFPMRIAYDKDIMKIGEELYNNNIEYFLPLDEKVDTREEEPRIIKTPKIKDLIFIYSTKSKLTDLKHTQTIFRYLRFITFIPHEAIKKQMTPLERSVANLIVIIPNEEMQQFKHTVTTLCEKVKLIPYSETFNHIGHKIRILQGPLSGTIGTLRRVKNNKHVFIDCGGIVTAELGYMPKVMYELIDNN